MFSNRRTAFLTSLCCVLGGVLLLVANKPLREPRGFAVLLWETKVNFTDREWVGRFPDPMSCLQSHRGQQKAEAISTPFRVVGSEATVSYQLLGQWTSGSVVLKIAEVGTGRMVERMLNVEGGGSLNGGDWRELRLDIPADLVGSDVRLIVEVRDLLPQDSGIRIRSRVDYYASAVGFDWWLWWQNNRTARVILVWGLGLVLALIGVRTLGSEMRPGLLVQGVVYLALSLLAWRWHAFFYWDEWYVLDAFRRVGWDLVGYTHNEHFIPFFWMVYLAELAIFGHNYGLLIGVSFAVQILNCFLLRALLVETLPVTLRREGLLLFVTGAYAIHPLHAEVLQWAFAQCILIQHTCFFLAGVYGLRYLKGGRASCLIVSVIACGSGPLFFGNGFIAFVQVPIFLIVGKWLSVIAEAKLMSGCSEGESRCLSLSNLARLGKALGCLLLMGVFCAWVYCQPWFGALGRSLLAHLPRLKAEFHLVDLTAYLFVGSQLGTILRGLGIFPSLDLEAAGAVFPGKMPEPMAGLSLELVGAGLGTLVSVGILAVIIFGGGRSKMPMIGLWGLGQFVAVSELLLPAIGRHNMALSQSLSLRYHSGGVLAIVLLLYAVLHVTVGLRTSPPTLIQRWGMLGLVWMMASAWLWQSVEYGDYSSFGVGTREFVARHREWTECFDPSGAGCAGGASGVGLRQSDGPTRPAYLINGLQSAELAAVLNALQ